jgi:hypothetical protein
MKQLRSVTLAAAMMAMSCAAVAADIEVMTQNQYLGADLAPVLGAATTVPFDPAAFNAAVVAALGKIAATRPAERARALADEIADRRPDVVGVQEAYVFGCTPYTGQLPGTGCDDPSIKAAFTDHLLDTQRALHGQYLLAGRVTNLSVAAIPFVVNGQPAVLSLADRDAIFVRKGLHARAVDLASMAGCAKPSDQGCNYTVAPDPFDTPLGAIAIERGFLAVDVAVEGRAYRVFNTHLEQRLLAPNLPQTRLLQVGQANQLLIAALTPAPDRDVIVIGDFNSAPEDAIPGAPTPYQLFRVVGGFTDAWLMGTHGWRADLGLSCCQAEDLLNRNSELYERIDLIFSLTVPTRVLHAELIGERVGDKTRPPGHDGLWPSDHAAVAARLKFDR